MTKIIPQVQDPKIDYLFWALDINSEILKFAIILKASIQMKTNGYSSVKIS
ncbi:hypothetical protein MARI151_20699 [Maribacter litoralis]|uniref:Uncharacterized protein n=1 Tax=Maribacter litoralis TaxID=2059726 RepID=A0A653R007_9FLAO|nr:hypothetical protein MARI151_20699 [Maribacter litoralis]